MSWKLKSTRIGWVALSCGIASLWGAEPAGAAPGVPVDETFGERGEFYSVQLHIHGSLSEGGGRMVDHAARAREAGTDLLWWTDHGGMLNPPFPEDLEAMGIDFEQGLIWIPATPTVPGHGFMRSPDSDFVEALEVDTTSTSGQHCLALVAQDGALPDSSRFAGFRYDIDHHHAVRSNFQDLTITFSAQLLQPSVPGRSVSVRAQLSDDREGEPYWIEFLATDGPLPPDESHLRFVRIPEIPMGQWSEVSIPLSEHVRQAYAYGRDMHYHGSEVGFRIEEDGYSGLLIDDYRFDVGGAELEAVLEMVQGFLDSLPEPEPLHFVGYEAAGGREKVADHHVTVFSRDGIPELADFTDPRFVPEDYPDNFRRWAHARGYVTSYAHIFGPTGTQHYLSDAERDARRDTLIANDAYGVDLLEVGYDNRGRPIDDHFATWDELLRRDVFVTGTGVSDKHEAHDWSRVKNRFVTWVWSEELSRGKILLHLTSGHASFGDPVVVGPDAFLVVRDGQPGGQDRFDMGDVVASDLDEVRLQFMGRYQGVPMELAMIAVYDDGADTLTTIVDGDGELFDVYRTLPVHDAMHVRAELRDLEFGRLHLASNPIHFRRAPPDPERPGLRRRRIVDLR